MIYGEENITIKIKDILQSYSFPNVIPHDEPWKSLSVDEIIDNGKDYFFDFSFPWYADDNTGLEEFKQLFLHKYYMRQIGCETTSLFKLYVQSRLMEKMPTYKQLYETTLLEYDPLSNRKLVTEYNETRDVSGNVSGTEERKSQTDGNGNTTVTNDSNRGKESNSSGSSNTTSNLNTETNNQAIHSENPEVTVANNDYASSMDREKKVTNETGNENVEANGNETVNEKITENNETNSSASSTVNENVSSSKDNSEKEEVSRHENVNGFYGDSMTDNIIKFREAILNLNEMICNDMKDLFLSYYGGISNGINW